MVSISSLFRDLVEDNLLFVDIQLVQVPPIKLKILLSLSFFLLFLFYRSQIANKTSLIENTMVTSLHFLIIKLFRHKLYDWGWFLVFGHFLLIVLWCSNDSKLLSLQKVNKMLNCPELGSHLTCQFLIPWLQRTQLEKVSPKIPMRGIEISVLFLPKEYNMKYSACTRRHGTGWWWWPAEDDVRGQPGKLGSAVSVLKSNQPTAWRSCYKLLHSPLMVMVVITLMIVMIICKL